jgi:hypothetical protein
MSAAGPLEPAAAALAAARAAGPGMRPGARRRLDSRYVPLLGTIVVFALTAGYGSFAYTGFF